LPFINDSISQGEIHIFAAQKPIQYENLKEFFTIPAEEITKAKPTLSFEGEFCSSYKGNMNLKEIRLEQLDNSVNFIVIVWRQITFMRWFKNLAFYGCLKQEDYLKCLQDKNVQETPKFRCLKEFFMKLKYRYF
jgi:hypothetical protein